MFSGTRTKSSSQLQLTLPHDSSSFLVFALPPSPASGIAGGAIPADFFVIIINNNQTRSYEASRLQVPWAEGDDGVSTRQVRLDRIE